MLKFTIGIVIYIQKKLWSIQPLGKHIRMPLIQSESMAFFIYSNVKKVQISSLKPYYSINN